MNQPEQQRLTNRTYPSVEATEDVEGHLRRDIVHGPETDDVEGHLRRDLDAPVPEDVEGHRLPVGAQDDEDTEGHLQPPRDLDIERF